MMTPVTIRDCAGWLHRARGRRGVVILPALGYEELASRRFLRRLADELALQGLPVLRPDLHGTADSLGALDDPGRLARWREDAHHAIDWLVDHTGVEEVALLGLRFGALLAGDIASERTDIAMLGLLAPPLSGKAYLREQAMLAGVIGQADPVVQGINLAGFHLLDETMSSIRTMGWAPPATALKLLLCEAPGAMAQGKLASAFGRNCAIDPLAFDGYEAMICDPTASIVPDETVACITRWVAQDMPAGHAAPLFSLAPPDLRGPGFREYGTTFGENSRLAGVVCEPVKPLADRRIVIIANAGGSPHIGWARMSVAMARHLAAQGIASLRMDMGGLGDSRAAFETEEIHHYQPATRRDLVAAIDQVENLGFGPVALAGLCSGAHHGFHAALMDRRVTRLMLVNTLCFIWGPDYALPLNAWARTRATALALDLRQQDAALGLFARLRARLSSQAMGAAKGTVKYILRQTKALSGPAGAGEGNPVREGFAALRQRGTKIALVFSEHDPALIELERYMGDELEQATSLAGIDKHVIAGADHTFTPLHARLMLTELLASFMLDDARTQGPQVPRVENSPLVSEVSGAADFVTVR